MSALGLEQLIPNASELTASMAERWVAASLARCAALREHDAWLYPADPAQRSMAERIHAAWRDWANDAEALLRSAESLTEGDRAVCGLDTLRDAIGRARAVIQQTPALVALRREQALRGEVYSIEEVRRELRLGDRR